jgi:hypothetical protein
LAAVDEAAGVLSAFFASPLSPADEAASAFFDSPFELSTFELSPSGDVPFRA